MNRDNFSSIISEQADRQFRELLTREALAAASAGRWQGELWRKLEESALSLALVPEEQGGVGLTAADAMEIVRLSGYRGLPLPLGETMIGKALWSAAGGDVGIAGELPMLLASIAEGGPAALHQTTSGMTLAGATAAVAFGDIPASLLLHARTPAGEGFLVLLDTQALPRTRHAGSAFEAQLSFRLDGIEVPGDRCLPWQPSSSLALHAHGAILRSMQMAGAMQRSMELGLQYAGERVQFGKSISRFAPVQDMLVEAAAETAAAVTAVGLAVEHWRLDPSDDSLFCIAAAKARSGEAAGKVSALIHQVHGAIGFTQEHVVHQYTRRLWAWRDDFGSESFWSQWIGERVCASPGGALWPLLARL
jgi:acyl-CoA dehydrogenase